MSIRNLDAGFRPASVAVAGAIITTVLEWVAARGIGFSQFVSPGNMADADFGDMPATWRMTRMARRFCTNVLGALPPCPRALAALADGDYNSGPLREAAMPKKTGETLIVVADGAAAKFFVRDEARMALVPARIPAISHPQSRKRARDLKSDKPGRSFSSASVDRRGAIEPKHDYQKQEKHVFAQQLANVLDSACADRRFDSLVLVAPRRSLGELRTLLSERVRARIAKEIGKDLTRHTPKAIWSLVSKTMEAAR